MDSEDDSDEIRGILYRRASWAQPFLQGQQAWGIVKVRDIFEAERASFGMLATISFVGLGMDDDGDFRRERIFMQTPAAWRYRKSPETYEKEFRKLLKRNECYLLLCSGKDPAYVAQGSYSFRDV